MTGDSTAAASRIMISLESALNTAGSIGAFFDTALFVDSGVVMHDMFNSKEWDVPWRTSFGVAVRAHVPPVLIITFEYSFSPESPSGMLTQSSVY